MFNFDTVNGAVQPRTFPLKTIELHSDSYLDEDDIVRFEAPYGHTK